MNVLHYHGLQIDTHSLTNLQDVETRDLRGFEIRFDLAVPITFEHDGPCVLLCN